MISITDNDTLLQYIPNVVETVEGETPLFEKIHPQLEITEQWLHDTIVGDTPIDEDKNKMVCTIIACEAFRRSVPSLDLILTPNGFGIVSNSNVAPASKERVERLMASLGEQRDKSIGSLLKSLWQTMDWRNSDQCQWLTSSFFMSPDEDIPVAKTMLKKDDGWEAFLELREKARPIELAYAEKWFGSVTCDKLKVRLIEDPLAAGEHAKLAKTIKRLILDEMQTGKRPVKDLDRCVDIIRKHSTLYPEWQSDPVAELFEEKWRFQNRKEAAGYFF